MKKFRWLSLALAMMLALSVCSFAAADEPITIEFWHTHGETFGGPALTEIIDAFNASNDKGITVVQNVYPEYTDINTALQMALPEHKGPALSTVPFANLNYMAQNFPFVTPQSVIDKYFPEDKDYLASKYEDSILGLGTAVTGDQLGLPYGLSIPLMYYNADLLEAAGLDTEHLPTTWQEVRVYAEAIKEKTGLPGLYVQLPVDTYSIIPMFYNAGVKSMFVSDGNGGFKSDFVTDEVVETWAWFQEMYQNGSAVFMTNVEALSAFSAGQIGMYLTTSARINLFSQSESHIVSNYHPSWKDNELVVCLGGNMLVIWGETEAQQKAAWEFIKYALQPENMAKFDNGTGYVPPTTDVSDDMLAILSNPLLGDLISEKSNARQWTSWPGTNGMQIDLALVAMRDAIYNEGADARTELEKTAAEIDELLK